MRPDSMSWVTVDPNLPTPYPTEGNVNGLLRALKDSLEEKEADLRSRCDEMAEKLRVSGERTARLAEEAAAAEALADVTIAELRTAVGMLQVQNRTLGEDVADLEHSLGLANAELNSQKFAYHVVLDNHRSHIQEELRLEQKDSILPEAMLARANQELLILRARLVATEASEAASAEEDARVASSLQQAYEEREHLEEEHAQAITRTAAEAATSSATALKRAREVWMRQEADAAVTLQRAHEQRKQLEAKHAQALTCAANKASAAAAAASDRAREDLQRREEAHERALARARDAASAAANAASKRAREDLQRQEQAHKQALAQAEATAAAAAKASAESGQRKAALLAASVGKNKELSTRLGKVEISLVECQQQLEESRRDCEILVRESLG